MDMDYCVCCGRYVPEGTWVCKACMEKAEEKTEDDNRKEPPDLKKEYK